MPDLWGNRRSQTTCTISALISAGSPIHTSNPNSSSSRSNQREYPVASIPTCTQIPRCRGPDRMSLLVHHCSSVPVHHTHQSLPLKCNRLKARLVIYACNHHVRLLSPEPWSSINHSLLGSRSRHCYAIKCPYLPILSDCASFGRAPGIRRCCAWLRSPAHPASRSENKSLRTANPDALAR